MIIDETLFSATYKRGSVTIRADRNTDRPTDPSNLSRSLFTRGGGLPICRRVERQDPHRVLLATPSKDLQHENSTRLHPELSVCRSYTCARRKSIRTHARTQDRWFISGSWYRLEIRSRPTESGGRDREKERGREKECSIPAFLPSVRDAHTKRFLVAEGRVEEAENRSDSRSESQFGKAWLSVPKRGTGRCEHRKSRNGRRERRSTFSSFASCRSILRHFPTFRTDTRIGSFPVRRKLFYVSLLRPKARSNSKVAKKEEANLKLHCDEI